MNAKDSPPTRIKIGVLQQRVSPSTGQRWFCLNIGRVRLIAVDDENFEHDPLRPTVTGEFGCFIVENVGAGQALDRSWERKRERARKASAASRAASAPRVSTEPAIASKEIAGPPSREAVEPRPSARRRSRKSLAEDAAKEALERLGVGDASLDDGSAIDL